MLKINCKKETDKIVNFIQNTFKAKGFKDAVLGVSGGLDSAVIYKLLIKTLGAENVYGYSLPYGEQKDIKDAYLAVKEGEFNLLRINIKPIVDTLIKNIPLSNNEHNKVRIGNIMARVRMTILFDLAKAINALVVGTRNKTELELGYFTLYGDGACALEPIGHLYKTQVRQLAKYLGVPKKIIDKAPSAGLWAGQTDEKEIGMSYEEIDKTIEYINTSLPLKYMDNEKRRIQIEVIVNKILKNMFKRTLPAILE